jgi:hypothetical protein
MNGNLSRRRALLSCLMALSALASAGNTSAAQTGGSVGSCSIIGPFECTIVSRKEGQDQLKREWPTAVIVWRSPINTPGMDLRSMALVEAAGRRYTALRRAAEDSGWSFIGGHSGAVIHVAAIDGQYRRLRIGDSVFQVPQRDSAIVLLVDVLSDSMSTAKIAGRTYIRGGPPDGYWPKYWTSGDTSFNVTPSNRDMLMTRYLRSNLLVAAFLDSR